MNLAILSGSANLSLAENVAATLGIALGVRELQRFPDGELHVEIHDSVRGRDVYLIQPTSPPVDTSLLELLFLADACRRAGAARLTAVIPYYGYARQDRRASDGEALGARIVADMLAAAAVDRVVVVDLHAPAIEGFFAVPLEHISAVSVLAEASHPSVRQNTVIVAPDLGALKLADRYARILHRPVVAVHKTRVSGEAVTVSGIIGEARGKFPFVVDDMISTGGTIEAAILALLAAGAVPEVTVVASHLLLVGPAVSRLRALPIQQLIASDSVVSPTSLPIPIQIVSLGPLLADTIGRLHRDEPLGDLIVQG